MTEFHTTDFRSSTRLQSYLVLVVPRRLFASCLMEQKRKLLEQKRLVSSNLKGSQRLACRSALQELLCYIILMRRQNTSWFLRLRPSTQYWLWSSPEASVVVVTKGLQLPLQSRISLMMTMTTGTWRVLSVSKTLSVLMRSVGYVIFKMVVVPGSTRFPEVFLKRLSWLQS